MSYAIIVKDLLAPDYQMCKFIALELFQHEVDHKSRSIGSVNNTRAESCKMCKFLVLLSFQHELYSRIMYRSIIHRFSNKKKRNYFDHFHLHWA